MAVLQRRRRVEKSFEGYVPNVSIGTGRVVAFKAPIPTFPEIFGKDKPTDPSVGSRILVLREWMAGNGLPECPRQFTPREFANFFDRHYKGFQQRSVWKHFERTAAGERDARQYLAKMASQLLAEATARPLVQNRISFDRAVGWTIESARLHGICLGERRYANEWHRPHMNP